MNMSGAELLAVETQRGRNLKLDIRLQQVTLAVETQRGLNLALQLQLAALQKDGGVAVGRPAQADTDAWDASFYSYKRDLTN
ncbi:hypothetical protein FOA52_004281 [Chlamydomonas sp. UWO 241]|nr:hypothetical protein FOA52_004281 [Chlamydomonas sp. UWO 241]